MELQELDVKYAAVDDLAPLQDMPLVYLECGSTKISSIRSLEGMPLTYLGIGGTAVQDLTPLKGMDLQRITLPLPVKRLKGLDILRAMESLQRINVVYGASTFEAADFWEKLDAGKIK